MSAQDVWDEIREQRRRLRELMRTSIGMGNYKQVMGEYQKILDNTLKGIEDLATAVNALEPPSASGSDESKE